MGAVGDFIMGGKKDKQTSKSGSSNSSTSRDYSQNQSSQGALSASNNNSNSVSHGYNAAYNPVSESMSPTLGMTAAGGNMLGALLGVPGYSIHGGPPTNYSTTPPPAPIAIPQGTPTPSASDLLGTLGGAIKSAIPELPTSPPTPPAPPAPPVVPGTPGTTPGTPGPTPDPTAGRPGKNGMRPMQARAMGGPVNANEPYLVGEKQPEVFVPQTSGTILPQAPANAPLPSAPAATTMAANVPPPVPAALDTTPGLTPTMPAPVPAPNAPAPMVSALAAPAMMTPPTPAPPPPPPPPTYMPNPSDMNQKEALGNWADSAGHQYLLDQGSKAITGNNSASGFLQSGATGEALQKLGMGLASTYQDNYIGHLLDFAKLGLGGASALSSAGGINNSGSNSLGGSNSASLGGSSGANFGSTVAKGSSFGDQTGTSHAKNGLLPDIAAFIKK